MDMIKLKKLGLPNPPITEELRKKLSSARKGKHQTEDAKRRISESRKRYLDEHPDNSSWLGNHSSKPSFGEKYFMEVFEKEKIPLLYHKRIKRYELDFYNEELKKIY